MKELRAWQFGALCAMVNFIFGVTYDFFYKLIDKLELWQYFPGMRLFCSCILFFALFFSFIGYRYGTYEEQQEEERFEEGQHLIDSKR